jgi:hypothetical protein
VPARAPGLRKLVKSALLARGFTAVATQGVEHEYVHPSGLPVHVDFGSRMGQLCYWVGDARSHGTLSYELLWGSRAVGITSPRRTRRDRSTCFPS